VFGCNLIAEKTLMMDSIRCTRRWAWARWVAPEDTMKSCNTFLRGLLGFTIVQKLRVDMSRTNVAEPDS
jgi:hypothetical protein